MYDWTEYFLFSPKRANNREGSQNFKCQIFLNLIEYASFGIDKTGMCCWSEIYVGS